MRTETKPGVIRAGDDRGLHPGVRVALVAMCGVAVWLLFVMIYSDIYTNASGAAIVLAGILLGVAVLAYRHRENAVIALPLAYVLAVLLSTVGPVSEASPRALLPSQVLLAMCIGAGLSAWRTASMRSRQWALALMGLSLLINLQALLHSPFPLSSSYYGLPLALGAFVAAVTGLVRPASRMLLRSYLLAALLLAPWLVWATLTYGRSAVEIGTFNINFISVPVGCGLVAAVLLFLDRRSPWLAVAAAVLGAVLVLGNSKTVLLGLFVAGVVIVWMRRRQMSSLRLGLLLTLVVVSALVAYLAPALLLSRAVDGTPIVPGTRTVGDAGLSVQLRLDLARESLPNVLVDPLLGVGPQGNVVYYRTDDAGVTTWSRGPMPDATGSYAPHTGLISMPTSLGLPLALLVFATWGYAMTARRDRATRRLLLPLVTYFAATALTMDWERSHMAALLWLPIGVLLAAEDG